MALIACRDVSFAYEGNIAVHGLSFSIEAGDYLCVVGENGSGKSTLIKGLLGLIAPRHGNILMDGLQPNDIGYLPQHIVMQKDFPASVFEVVLSGCLSRRGVWPFYTRKDRADAGENLKRLGVSELRSRNYCELSRGQQQRVLLARALCATRKALLLDEPATGLDPAASQDFYRLIREINGSGITVVMVSHDIRSAAAYANHILHLRNEQIFFGPTEEYIKTGVGAQFLGHGGDNGHDGHDGHR